MPIYLKGSKEHRWSVVEDFCKEPDQELSDK